MKINVELQKLPIMVSSLPSGQLKKLPEGFTGVPVSSSLVQSHLDNSHAVTHLGSAMTGIPEDVWYCQTEDLIFIAS